MFRAILLTYWEIRRLLRTRAAIATVLGVPIVGILLNLLLRHHKMGHYFPLIALISAATMVYTRFVIDRCSGFAAGLNSTPSAGPITIGARILTCILAAATQMMIFGLFYHLLG